MKRINFILLSIILISGIMLISFNQDKEFQLNAQNQNKSKFHDLKGPYLGQKPPGMTPEIFAHSVVSTDSIIEMGCTFSPDGRAFYFARSQTSDIGSNWAIWVVEEQGGVWNQPEVVPFSGVYRDFAPFITPDGKYMLFYRMSSDGAETRKGTWIVERRGDAWSEPRFFVYAYCLTTEDFRTFYFTTERSEETSKDIGQMTLYHGIFSEPMKLEGGMNSDEWEAHGSISPDGSFMLFDRVESTFVSFRKDDGTWIRGYDLGGKFHIPSVSPDGRYIFFESNGDIYWVDAKIIEKWGPEELK